MLCHVQHGGVATADSEYEIFFVWSFIHNCLCISFPNYTIGIHPICVGDEILKNCMLFSTYKEAWQYRKDLDYGTT